MKFYSEILKRFYDTAEDCVAAEVKDKKEKDAAAEKEAKLKAEKDARLKEVNKALEKAEKLLKAYIKDYGNFSMSVNNPLIDFLNNSFLPF